MSLECGRKPECPEETHANTERTYKLFADVVLGQFLMEHHTLPDMKSRIVAPDHLGGIEFDLQPLWSAQTFDSPYQLWRATSSYSRKDYSGEYTIYLIPCTVQPTQSWVDPGDKPLACTAHAPERFLIPIAFQQTNRPVPVVYSLNTEFQLCNNEKIFLMDPTKTEMSLAEMDYKGAFSKGQTLYGRVLWNPDQNLNSAYKLQLEKVYLCTGKDGYVPFFDPTGTIYNEGPQYGCIQPNKNLKHRFLLLDRHQPEVTDIFFHDVPFDAAFAAESSDFHAMSSLPGVDGFTMKVDALYKVETGHQWYLQVIYIIGPETMAGPRVQRSLTYQLRRARRDLVDKNGRLTLDDSLIYDNEGDQVKNGTNMKTLNLEMESAATAASQTGASIGSAFAAIMLLMLVLLSVCLITQKCRRNRKKKPPRDAAEEYPLNTKVDASRKNLDRMEKRTVTGSIALSETSTCSMIAKMTTRLKVFALSKRTLKSKFIITYMMEQKFDDMLAHTKTEEHQYFSKLKEKGMEMNDGQMCSTYCDSQLSYLAMPT
ncbi:unnamed protein product, partial [Ranitomeya imitator]